MQWNSIKYYTNIIFIFFWSDSLTGKLSTEDRRSPGSNPGRSISFSPIKYIYFYNMEDEDFKKENKTLKVWIETNWGKRCPDYEKDCALCKAWKYYDYLVVK